MPTWMRHTIGALVTRNDHDAEDAVGAWNPICAPYSRRSDFGPWDLETKIFVRDFAWTASELEARPSAAWYRNMRPADQCWKGEELTHKRELARVIRSRILCDVRRSR